jgi:hypothetical protein
MNEEISKKKWCDINLIGCLIICIKYIYKKVGAFDANLMQNFGQSYCSKFASKIASIRIEQAYYCYVF